MTQRASDEYLRNAVMTATPEQLQLMLYDGAIRFATQARDAIAVRDYETSCEKLIRAQQIVIQMQSGLNHEANPTLCGRLAALYDFIYRRLVDANMTRNTAAIDDALKILRHQRETWQRLIEKVRGTTAPPAEPAPERQTDFEVGAALSIEG